MRKNRWVAKAMLSVSLASICSLSLAKVSQQDTFSNHQTGIASYYSDKFQGRPTASGEPYDKNSLTAAHATLPFGTRLHVVNLKNHRSVDVRVNCRPHPSNKRILDLSKRAAKELGFLQAGTAKVEIEVVSLG
jgi:rare lipoprotein A